MRSIFKVVCEIEVRASSPEIAVIVARDMMLDPGAKLYVDVLPFEYVKEAEDWFATDDHGWAFSFNTDYGPPATCRKPTSPTEPSDCIPWSSAPLKLKPDAEEL